MQQMHTILCFGERSRWLHTLKFNLPDSSTWARLRGHWQGEASLRWFFVFSPGFYPIRFNQTLNKKKTI